MTRVSRTHKGFTLIEMLVVVVIVSVILAMAVMSFGSLNSGRNTKMTAEQLQRAMNAAKAQAILMPQVLALRLTPRGYEFLTEQKNKTGQLSWCALKEDALSNKNAFAKNVEANIVKLGSSHSQIELSHEVNKQILFNQTGNITPFTLLVSNRAHTAVFRLIVKEGRVVIESGGGAHAA